MIFYYYANKLIFTRNVLKLALVLRVRLFGTLKWPIKGTAFMENAYLTLYPLTLKAYLTNIMVKNNNNKNKKKKKKKKKKNNNYNNII